MKKRRKEKESKRKSGVPVIYDIINIVIIFITKWMNTEPKQLERA